MADIDWTDLPQDRQAFANIVKIRVSKNEESLLPSQGTITLTRRTVLHAVKQPVSWLPIIMYLVCFQCI